VTTSHATETDPIGRPAAPSAGFRPHPDITRVADGWLLRERIEIIPPDHFRREVEGKAMLPQSVLDCVSCGRGVFILSPDTGRPGYQVNVAQLRSAVVAHLHAHHEEALSGI
jgi:hypothetical protein